ncbi:S-adenosyl-L-methionine-dependent methyltransferase [Infundibulicybe gibba]|nr:S-adenosyl-L-methionine-dependent methyltransferase [Infundibulicybe gibba]
MNFYFEAAATLDRLDAKQGSIKGVLATLPEKNRKRTAALVIETLKYKSALVEIINVSGLLAAERKLTSLNLALVLVHDLLLSNGSIQAGDGPVKQAVLRHKTRLNGEFQKLKIRHGAKSNADLAHTGDGRAAQIPRYVRVNTSMWSTEAAIEYFMKKGFTLDDPFGSRKGFAKDEHVSNLLLFHPQTTFHDDPAYKSGKVILQDKASCFPALVLSPPSEDSAVVIDATAAPGNKTSHLSALMQNKGKLYAFERDRHRFKTLSMMLSRAGCKNVETRNEDFLLVDPSDSEFARVTHILLDPSCSGSGIVNRLDHLLETEEENEVDQEDRLQKLATFQLKMIKHAMKFPGVRKIVYSTCSVHPTENEHVVQSALSSDEAKLRNFFLAPQNEVLPQWPRRGLKEELEAGDSSCLIRCSPGEDATNGFFVSCFITKAPPSTKRKLTATSRGDGSVKKRKKNNRSS